MDLFHLFFLSSAIALLAFVIVALYASSLKADDWLWRESAHVNVGGHTAAFIIIDELHRLPNFEDEHDRMDDPWPHDAFVSSARKN